VTTPPPEVTAKVDVVAVPAAVAWRPANPKIERSVKTEDLRQPTLCRSVLEKEVTIGIRAEGVKKLA
jgi:hypothetical protein